jgi:LysR family glycine cleavage system transcriptional activator
LKRLAPLNALRAFEVDARTGSFTNAAREMGVSSAAVSQQVKQFE